MTRRIPDNLDRHSPIRKPTTTNPWAGYLRCDECGAEPDTVCRDLDDKPAVEVCDGRRMVDAWEDGDRRHTRPVKSTRNASKVEGACAHCGAGIFLQGAAVATGTQYCQRRECRAEKKRAKDARRVQPCQRCQTPMIGAAVGRRYCSDACRKGPPQMCPCGKPTPSRHAAFCGAVCRRAAMADRMMTTTVPCFHCGDPLPAVGPAARRATARYPVCRSAACLAARKRAEYDDEAAKRERLRTIPWRFCVGCGTSFRSTSPIAKYCEPRCRHTHASRVRRAAERVTV